ncbi:HAMP domain-containing histidine kinase [Deferribacter autotrophicus]|uniref:histidine kinase n=1 Tax=Deferribacter autotrophicus TaxID=500465 RepID=A0A5A8F3L2_9BACT|nr:HAMP domain-containing sensor histidine kinase [Deferribacter autotrophicus]KAA0257959.1 HAMP domain-containing histidine kinase [Deferribacter autotrophicus]
MLYILSVISTVFVTLVYFSLKSKNISYIPDIIITSYLFILTFFIIKKLKETESELKNKIEALNTTTNELKTSNEELQALNLQLLKSKKEYEKLANYHNNILINMNHELKTPLNSIIGFTTLLINDYESLSKEDIINSLKLIDESAKRLNLMLSNIINLSKQPSGDIESEKKCGSCKYVIESLISTIKGLIKSNMKVVFNYNLPDTLPDVIYDEKIVNNILLNIALASVISTEKGVIELQIQSDPDFLIIEITDTGKPFNLDKVKNYFLTKSTDINTNEPEYKLFLSKQLAINNNIDLILENTQFGNKYILKLKRC